MSPAKAKKGAGPAVIDASRDARRLASMILEVLAGMRTTTEAAEALGVSLPRYYTLEIRAINGLIAACEPRPKGRVKSRQSRIDDLEKENAWLRKECSRHQALLRTAQRAVGVPARAKTAGPGGNGKAKKRRRSKARALKVVGMLKKQDAGEPAATS
jgi:hypothetical protein